MAFCSNCGEQIKDGAKYCNGCGVPVDNTVTRRRTTYEGEIHKCPNCGEILNSLVTNCPSCGHEIRGSKASDLVREFAIKLSHSTSEEQKIALLRSFPIPNTKEDIFEFMILAASNMNSNNKLRQDISDAWLVKFEQSYKKALLLFKDDSDFSRIQKIYDEGYSNIIASKKREVKRNTIEVIARNGAICLGTIAVIVAVIVDKTGGNASLIELIGYIVLIVSACTLVRRGASMIDIGIGALSGLLTIGLSFILNNGSMGMLCGGILMIITAVSFFKSVENEK